MIKEFYHSWQGLEGQECQNMLTIHVYVLQILMFPRQDHGRFSVTDVGTLVINPVRKEDAGEYVCQALSVAGSAFAKANVEVRGNI